MNLRYLKNKNKQNDYSDWIFHLCGGKDMCATYAILKHTELGKSKWFGHLLFQGCMILSACIVSGEITVTDFDITLILLISYTETGFDSCE